MVKKEKGSNKEVYFSQWCHVEKKCRNRTISHDPHMECPTSRAVAESIPCRDNIFLQCSQCYWLGIPFDWFKLYCSKWSKIDKAKMSAAYIEQCRATNRQGKRTDLDKRFSEHTQSRHARAMFALWVLANHRVIAPRFLYFGTGPVRNMRSQVAINQVLALDADLELANQPAAWQYEHIPPHDTQISIMKDWIKFCEEAAEARQQETEGAVSHSATKIDSDIEEVVYTVGASTSANKPPSKKPRLEADDRRNTSTPTHEGTPKKPPSIAVSSIPSGSSSGTTTSSSTTAPTVHHISSQSDQSKTSISSTSQLQTKKDDVIEISSDASNVLSQSQRALQNIHAHADELRQAALPKLDEIVSISDDDPVAVNRTARSDVKRESKKASSGSGKGKSLKKKQLFSPDRQTAEIAANPGTRMGVGLPPGAPRLSDIVNQVSATRKVASTTVSRSHSPTSALQSQRVEATASPNLSRSLAQRTNAPDELTGAPEKADDANTEGTNVQDENIMLADPNMDIGNDSHIDMDTSVHSHAASELYPLGEDADEMDNASDIVSNNSSLGPLSTVDSSALPQDQAAAKQRSNPSMDSNENVRKALAPEFQAARNVDKSDTSTVDYVQRNRDLQAETAKLAAGVKATQSIDPAAPSTIDTQDLSTEGQRAYKQNCRYTNNVILLQTLDAMDSTWKFQTEEKQLQLRQAVLMRFRWTEDDVLPRTQPVRAFSQEMLNIEVKRDQIRDKMTAMVYQAMTAMNPTWRTLSLKEQSKTREQAMQYLGLQAHQVHPLVGGAQPANLPWASNQQHRERLMEEQKAKELNAYVDAKNDTGCTEQVPPFHPYRRQVATIPRWRRPNQDVPIASVCYSSAGDLSEADYFNAPADGRLVRRTPDLQFGNKYSYSLVDYHFQRYYDIIEHHSGETFDNGRPYDSFDPCLTGAGHVVTNYAQTPQDARKCIKFFPLSKDIEDIINQKWETTTLNGVEELSSRVIHWQLPKRGIPTTLALDSPVMPYGIMPLKYPSAFKTISGTFKNVPVKISDNSLMIMESLLRKSFVTTNASYITNKAMCNIVQLPGGRMEEMSYLSMCQTLLIEDLSMLLSQALSFIVDARKRHALSLSVYTKEQQDRLYRAPWGRDDYLFEMNLLAEIDSEEAM